MNFTLFMYLYFHDKLPISKITLKQTIKYIPILTRSASSIHITYKRAIIMAKRSYSMEQLNDSFKGIKSYNKFETSLKVYPK